MVKLGFIYKGRVMPTIVSEVVPRVGESIFLKMIPDVVATEGIVKEVIVSKISYYFNLISVDIHDDVVIYVKDREELDDTNRNKRHSKRK